MVSRVPASSASLVTKRRSRFSRLGRCRVMSKSTSMVGCRPFARSSTSSVVPRRNGAAGTGSNVGPRREAAVRGFDHTLFPGIETVMRVVETLREIQRHRRTGILVADFLRGPGGGGEAPGAGGCGNDLLRGRLRRSLLRGFFPFDRCFAGRDLRRLRGDIGRRFVRGSRAAPHKQPAPRPSMCR